MWLCSVGCTVCVQTRQAPLFLARVAELAAAPLSRTLSIRRCEQRSRCSRGVPVSAGPYLRAPLAPAPGPFLLLGMCALSVGSRGMREGLGTVAPRGGTLQSMFATGLRSFFHSLRSVPGLRSWSGHLPGAPSSVALRTRRAVLKQNISW